MGPGGSRTRQTRARRSTGLPSLLYLDSSALFKLVVAENESRQAWLFAGNARWTSSELVVTELRRAIRSRATGDPAIDLSQSLERSEIVLDRVAFRRIDHLILWRAGRLFMPPLRSLDAIHLATALELRPLEALMTYDRRQAVAAREVGLRIVSPGMKL